MENSFFEYRDHTGVESDSDSEIIDNSFSQSSVPKTPAKKNQTVYVPESDDSTEDESEKENAPINISKSMARRNSLKLHHVVLSSDDDKSSRGSIQRHSESSNKVVITSSEDEANQISPEIIPKRRPLVKPSPRSSDSFIGRKKKHMILLDSESDNSFVKGHVRKKKCLKDTPVKIESVRKNITRDIKNMSIQNDSIVSDNDNEQVDDSENSDESHDENPSQESDVSESESEYSDSDNQDRKNDDRSHKTGDKQSYYHKHKDNSHKHNDDKKDDKDTSLNEVSDSDNNDLKNKYDDKKQSYDCDAKEPSLDKDHVTERNDGESSRNKGSDCSNENADETSEKKDSVISSTSDDGLEEEQMVMSRATRMSIMGVIPKENDSDDSDFIESDDTAHSSRVSSSENLYIGPNKEETHRNTTPETPTKIDNGECSTITCSPITNSPDHVTNEINNSLSKNDVGVSNDDQYSPEVCILKKNVLNKVNKEAKMLKENVIDDDVTIIDKEPEIIALSSDDEVEVKEDKSPNRKKSSIDNTSKKESTSQSKTNDMKKYLPPPSYPNQIVFVKKHVRENELSKLNGLREDLQNVRYLLDNMDVDTLPDRGAKLLERLEALERDVQRQGDKVASMVVEPDMPTPQQVSQDGFAAEDKGLSWDDIQKASNAVQPRMFGKQAMATHMAERSLILDRLRDLYESLASRPSEQTLAKQPANVKSELMEHQLHALAWLQWRETQKPAGGILADDMGLGKTITMISLIVADKAGSIDNDEDDDDDSPRRQRLVRGGTLVVCPATLVQQWAAEVSKHCTSYALSVCLHHGSARATQPHRLATNDLVITTYNILQREKEKDGVLSRVRWRRVILDEAHVVRNHKSATSQGVCGLRARRRWALTGTPLHNKDLDLFALLKFLRCTPFDDLTMWKKWIDNKSLGGSERLNTIMSCVMLRRTKQQLQERGQLTCLPERSAHELSVTLTQEEMNVYQKVLVFSKTLFAQFLHQRAEKSGQPGLMPRKKDDQYAKMHKKMIALQGAKPVKSHEILVLLLRLRQVCCHCGLIAAMLDHDDNTELSEDVGSQDLLTELDRLTLEDNNSSRRKSGGKKDEEEDVDEGTTAAEAIKSVLSSNNPVFNLQRQSSKIKAVMECLHKNVFKNKGEKAVVVSQWTSVLNLVERELTAARIRSVTLRGDVPVPARAPLISALNDPKSDVRVMLLSLCAGGVGLNLCGANHLLLLDPHWNPQLEEQAQDRIYRVGQPKPVHIYKFMCVDTVEQSIRTLQKAKLELAENVLTGAKNTNGSKLSIEDLKILFNMGPQAGS